MLSTNPSRSPYRAADAVSPQALAYWPFSALTPQQQAERRAMEFAAQRDELRRPPTIFGSLS